MIKLGILSTHPIQYHSPLFRTLQDYKNIDLTVYYCHKPTPEQQGEGFGVSFSWDVDLTSGFKHVFLKNISSTPAKGFGGYDCPEIKDIIYTEKFDYFIVHGWFFKAAWQAYFACWKHGAKIAVRSDSQIPNEVKNVKNKIKELTKILLYPFFIRKFDVCLPYGQRSADYFRKYFARNIVIAPHFIDNDFFEKECIKVNDEREILRKKWGIPKYAKCFLFCGKFQSIKRPLDILQGLKELVQSSTSPIHLLMVGDGKLRGKCENYVKTHRLPVTFTGFLNQQQLPHAYAVSDCLILSSYSETWGLVVNEAMACGLPVIVSKSCGCSPDLVIEGETGYTFEMGNIEQLCQKMIVFLNEKNFSKFERNTKKHIKYYTAKNASASIISALNSSSKV